MFVISEIERKNQSELINKLCLTWIVANALVMTAGILIYPPASYGRWVFNIIIVTSISLISIVLNYYKHPRIAANVLPIGMFFYVSYLAYTGGGTLLPGISNFIPIVLTTGFLLGRQKAVIMAVLCIAVTLCLAYMETEGYLPPVNFVRTPLGRAIALILPISIAVAIQFIANKQISNSLLSLREAVLKLEESEKNKDTALFNLNERVKELKMLYKIGSILQDEETSQQVLYQEIVNTLPMGWQFPESTGVRLLVDGVEYTTANYISSRGSLKAGMTTQNGKQLELEVVCLRSDLEINQDPFLPEEHNLVKLICDMLIINMEKTMRRAELKDYKVALDVAAMVSFTDINGNFLGANENFCKVSKYSVDELIGKHHSILWSGYHPPEYFKEMGNSMQSGKPYKGEFCNKAKDGSLYWVETTIVPFLDETGKLYQYLSIIQDISERKKATALYDYQFYNSPDLIVIVNKDYKIEAVNRIPPDKTNLDEVIGSDAIEILPFESREIARTALVKCFETGDNQEFENTLTMGRWVNSRMVPMVLNGQMSHVMIFASDITKRKMAEEATRQNEKLLRKITSQIPGNTYMFEIEEDGSINTHYFSKGSDEVNQFLIVDDPNIATGELRSFIHDEDKVIWNRAMRSAYITPKDISIQFRVIVNGQIRWRWFRAVPEISSDGKVMWYGVGNDITQIVEYIISIEQIIFDISHVIRRPIATMMGMTKLINDPEISDTEIREMSKKLYSISEEMDKFIKELNNIYNTKRSDGYFKFDISYLIDKRDSFFN